MTRKTDLATLEMQIMLESIPCVFHVESMAFLAKQMVVFAHSEYMIGFHDNHWMSESLCAVLVASAETSKSYTFW